MQLHARVCADVANSRSRDCMKRRKIPASGMHDAAERMDDLATCSVFQTISFANPREYRMEGEIPAASHRV